MEYLNKKIEMYDDLAIVVGKDTAMGSFSKLYVDIENELDNGDSIEFVADNGEEGVVDKWEECDRVIHHWVGNFQVPQKRACTSL